MTQMPPWVWQLPLELLPDELEVAMEVEVEVEVELEAELEVVLLAVLEVPLPLDPPIVLDAVLEALLPPLPPGPLPVNEHRPLAHSKPLQQSSVLVHDWFALRQTPPPVVPFEPVAAEQAARQRARAAARETRANMGQVGTTVLARASIGPLVDCC
jgi:hypothetical protein